LPGLKILSFILPYSAIALGSIVGEAAADYQLAKFKEDTENSNKVCQAGLWNYSRHPNYFFEWTYWWSYVVLAIGSKKALATSIAPLAMLFTVS
jgi:steroid 5-alpha reductase family enzyme